MVSSPTRPSSVCRLRAGLRVRVQGVGVAVAVTPRRTGHDVEGAGLAQGRDLRVAAAQPHVRRHHGNGARLPRLAAEHPEVADVPTRAARSAIWRRLLVVIAVEALVEPGLLELVGADEQVPELMAALVDGDALGALQRGRREDGGAAREQRRVFHAARRRAPGGIDDGELVVGIRRRPGAVAAQRDLRGLDVAARRGASCSGWTRRRMSTGW